MNAQEHMEKIKAAIRDMPKETVVTVEYIGFGWGTTIACKSYFEDAQFTVRIVEVDEAE